MSSASDADVTFTLQADPKCDSTLGTDRDFIFANYEDGEYDMIILPNSGDVIRLAGSAASCGADTSISCEEDVTIVRLIGRTSGAWLAIPLVGTCICTP